MSAIKAHARPVANGVDPRGLVALHKLAMSHNDVAGGLQLNGGCHDGCCERGSRICAAWTRILAIVARELPEEP